jgi:SNF2 family DNA or RNA helicase
MDQRIVKYYVSARMRAVIALLGQLSAAHPTDKILCFSSFASALHLLTHLLVRDLHWTLGTDMGEYMGTGETPVGVRERTLDRFETQPAMRLLLITYKAGGAGMNLQHANHVIELEPPWNNAIMEQAEARVRRPPQKKTVFIYRFYAPLTIEERVNAVRSVKEAEWTTMRRAADEPGATVDAPAPESVVNQILGFAAIEAPRI